MLDLTRIAFSFGLLVGVPLVTAQNGYDNALYLIRHGEKPSNGSNGLTAQGEERAQCLRNVFGSNSTYNIGYIMAEAYKSDGSRERPYETVEPLATDLGLTVDVSCSRDDPGCVADAVQAYAETTGSTNVLICWEHAALTDIASALGVQNPPEYPDASYNYIWEIQDQSLISNTTSENCPGLNN